MMEEGLHLSVTERGGIVAYVYLQFIQHKSLEIVCIPWFLVFIWVDNGINFKDLGLCLVQVVQDEYVTNL